jgi:hypothetical protein
MAGKLDFNPAIRFAVGGILKEFIFSVPFEC